MKNAMQLKAIVKNIAKEKNIKAQEVLDIYLLERLLERVSQSKYRNHFILKGGFLIASIVGVDNRTTMDIDATIKTYNQSNIKFCLPLDKTQIACYNESKFSEN